MSEPERVTFSIRRMLNRKKYESTAIEIGGSRDVKEGETYESALMGLASDCIAGLVALLGDAAVEDVALPNITEETSE